MNRSEHLLTCLSEECVEVAKEVSKALRFSLDEQYVSSDYTNRERVVKELKDVLCLIEICRAEGIIPAVHVTENEVADKLTKIERYMEISRAYGALV